VLPEFTATVRNLSNRIALMTLAFAPERIEHWPLGRLQPYARNAKLHGPEHVAKIAATPDPRAGTWDHVEGRWH
jgi:hypothetical protein